MKKWFVLCLLLGCWLRMDAAGQDASDKMSWFGNAKLGMFIHWGVYSKIAGVWNGSDQYNEFVMLQAKIPVAEYEKVAATFRPEKMDVEKWVVAAKKAGMKYVVFTSKHHEGFAMYHSKCSPYNIYDFTGFHRDPLKELADACRKHGLKLGIYYSLGRDWHDPDVPTNWPTKGGRSNTWDYPDEDAKDVNRYMERKVKPQVKELLEQYHPDLIWFDTFEMTPKAQSQAIRKMILDFDPNIIINDRIGHGLGDYRTLEQRESGGIIPGYWEACITMSKNWGYMKADNDFKSPQKIVGLLIDVVSKGGNLLLNVGPTPEGILQPRNLERLDALGKWMKANGEAIYGTRPWKVYGEKSRVAPVARKAQQSTGFEDAVYDGTTDVVQDIRFTAGDDCVYLFARNWQDETVVSESLAEKAGKISSVELLGYRKKLDWQQTSEGLFVRIPRRAVNELKTYAFKVKFE